MKGFADRIHHVTVHV